MQENMINSCKQPAFATMPENSHKARDAPT